MICTFYTALLWCVDSLLEQLYSVALGFAVPETGALYRLARVCVCTPAEHGRFVTLQTGVQAQIETIKYKLIKFDAGYLNLTTSKNTYLRLRAFACCGGKGSKLQRTCHHQGHSQECRPLLQGRRCVRLGLGGDGLHSQPVPLKRIQYLCVDGCCDN